MPYVARNPDSSIYGQWATQQWDGQEYLPDGHIDLMPTADAILETAKIARAQEVASIVVTTSSGKQFDGDEVSQTRMARAMACMSDAETISWVLVDNSIAQVDRAEIREALRLAGLEQSRLWIKPYTG